MMHKKFFITLIVVAVLIGGFQVFNIYKNPKGEEQVLTTPTGMVRDTSQTIPSAFPTGIILEEDIKVIQESYTYNQTPNASPTQHTFKYISIKNLSDTRNYFIGLLTNNGNKPVVTEVSTTLTLINGLTKGGKALDILIDSSDQNNVSVEITIIQ